MNQNPTDEALAQRVKELENEAVRLRQAEESINSYGKDYKAMKYIKGKIIDTDKASE